MINMALISIAVSWGFGRHLETLEPTRSIQALKYDYVQQPFHVMSSAFGRISFALFLVDIIQKFTARKRLLYSLMALQFAINGSTAILIMVQCRPVQALWNRTIENTCLSPRVQEYYSFFQGCRSRYDPTESEDAFLTDSTSCQCDYRFHPGRVPSHVHLAASDGIAEEDWFDNGVGPWYIVSICSAFIT